MKAYPPTVSALLPRLPDPRPSMEALVQEPRAHSALEAGVSALEGAVSRAVIERWRSGDAPVCARAAVLSVAKRLYLSRTDADEMSGERLNARELRVIRAQLRRDADRAQQDS